VLDFASFVFYVLAALTILSAGLVISARNPVHSVLFLILAFFNAAGLFVLLGAEYIAMTLVIVYVGAVAVLFLFVVMMLNINFVELRQGFLRYLPAGLGVAVLLFAELFLVLKASIGLAGAKAEVAHAIPSPADVTNTVAIGNILYTDFFLPFQLSGLILLVAMIGAIVLTLRHRPDSRRQKIFRQVNRMKEDTLVIVKSNPGEGA